MAQTYDSFSSPATTPLEEPNLSDVTNTTGAVDTPPSTSSTPAALAKTPHAVHFLLTMTLGMVFLFLAYASFLVLKRWRDHQNFYAVSTASREITDSFEMADASDDGFLSSDNNRTSGLMITRLGSLRKKNRILKHDVKGHVIGKLRPKRSHGGDIHSSGGENPEIGAGARYIQAPDCPRSPQPDFMLEEKGSNNNGTKSPIPLSPGLKKGPSFGASPLLEEEKRESRQPPSTPGDLDSAMV